MDKALEICGVTKSFGSTLAIEGLDLVVPRAATYGLIGPSGAGKTTAIRMIMAILFPDCGSLRVLGKASALEAKDRIGYLPEERGVYRKMRVDQFLSYIGRLKGGRRAEVAVRARGLLGRLGLAEAATKKCEELSKGMLQRVQFVAAIINQPELLILDEPFGGLDPLSVRLLQELIAEEQRRGATIIFSTHVMAHAEELCQHVVMIHKGRKVLDEPIAGLRRRYDVRTIRLEPLNRDTDPAVLRTVGGVESVRAAADDALEVRLAEGTDPGSAIRAIAALIPPARIELARVRLEDVFIRLVTGRTSTDESNAALRTHLQGLGIEGATP
ncbi:MAG TPA: ATP-binding cassette domain-containing protein [Steroidobacteraceae bacterium]|nr:ATP-binding cassette domain-containing protein [Steroidobacteraceae bacterium]